MTKVKELLAKYGLGLGIILSIGYAALAVYFLWRSLESGTKLELNAVGDYLAGVFSPLAFLWLVIGYLMQHFELKLSRSSIEKQAEELELTRQTLEQQLIEYKESVKLTQMSYEFHQSFQTKLYEESIEPHQPRITDFSVAIGWNNAHSQFESSLTAFHIKTIIISFKNTGAIAKNCTYQSNILRKELQREPEKGTYIQGFSGTFPIPDTSKIIDGKNTLILDYIDLNNELANISFRHNQDEGELLDTIELRYTDAKDNRRKLSLYIFSHLRINLGLTLSVTTQNNNPFKDTQKSSYRL